MKLYVVTVWESGESDGVESSRWVEFSERAARRVFRRETREAQEEMDGEAIMDLHNYNTGYHFLTAELSRVVLPKLPKRSLVRRLIQSGGHAGDRTILTAWEYEQPTVTHPECRDCGEPTFRIQTASKGVVHFCSDCDHDTEGADG